MARCPDTVTNINKYNFTVFLISGFFGLVVYYVNNILWNWLPQNIRIYFLQIVFDPIPEIRVIAGLVVPPASHGLGGSAFAPCCAGFGPAVHKFQKGGLMCRHPIASWQRSRGESGSRTLAGPSFDERKKRAHVPRQSLYCLEKARVCHSSTQIWGYPKIASPISDRPPGRQC